MRIDIITLFPEFFAGPLKCSILGRAQAAGVVTVRLHNLRDYADDAHRTVDDYPYGGGAGMVLKPEPVFRACEAVLEGAKATVALLTPQGERFNQEAAARLAGQDRLVLICGHYEGFDERIRTGLANEEISIGDYVLTGGEIAAVVVTDAVVRLLPGAVGNDQSPMDESFGAGLLEYPHYTRPAEFRGLRVPAALLGGHHEQIRRWRRKQSLRRTLERRPELLARVALTEEDRELLAEAWRELSATDRGDIP